jgi:hypothetical protein
MIASVHIADLGARSSLKLLARPPKPNQVAGLRWSMLALGAPLGPSVRPRPDLGRLGLVAFWDDDGALDTFERRSPLAATLAEGFRVRLAPLRASGTWPGLPPDLPHPRSVAHDGPVAALTLGRLRLTQGLRFLRTSAKAEAAVLRADGMTWATGFGRPPYVSTFSMWADTAAVSAYAYGDPPAGHPDALAAERQKPFHHESAFVRFRPYAMQGGLRGTNPLAEHWPVPAA